MSGKTAIPWCHHTFNPLWGCVEVSPACDHCYAREQAKRYGHAVWGPAAARRFFGDMHWDEPLAWQRKAAAAGERRRVFCASMADVLEERDDAVGRALDEARRRLWDVIANTPALDWLLLTKRPQNYRRFVPVEILALPNVWPGTTVESPACRWRATRLQQLSAAGPRWMSYEPALDWVDFRPYAGWLSWLMFGGESGGRARLFRWQWARAVITHGRARGLLRFSSKPARMCWRATTTTSGE